MRIISASGEHERKSIITYMLSCYRRTSLEAKDYYFRAAQEQVLPFHRCLLVSRCINKIASER